MTTKNYWQRQEMRRARMFQARDQFGQAVEPLDLDSAYNEPRYQETRQCPQGHIAYRKASVGTFVCPSCGSLQASNGEWTAPRY